MLTVVCTPPRGNGRPRIYGTILADEAGQMVLVKNLFSGAENVGNAGSPRVEIWLALRRESLMPVVVRGRPATDGTVPPSHAARGVTRPRIEHRPAEWAMLAGKHELSPDNLARLAEYLAGISYATTDVWPPNGHRASAPTWPLSLTDSRVVLPDDGRWPKKHQQPRARNAKRLLAELESAAAEMAWAIEAQILAVYSLRVRP